MFGWVFVFSWFWIHTASTPSTSGTHTDGGAVIRKARAAWLEGTPAICINFVGFLFGFESTQLARQVQSKHTRMEVQQQGSLKAPGRIERHSRNGPQTYYFYWRIHSHMFWSRHSHTQTYKQTRNRTKHKSIIVDQVWICRHCLFKHHIWINVTMYFVSSHVSIYSC